MPPNPHDALFKWTFSQPELAAAELRAVLPRPLVKRLNLDRLTLAEGSFIDKDLQGSQADRLFHVPCDDRLAFVYVLFEHQSTVDPLMPLRLLAYMVRIWQRHVANHGSSALPLPVIIPVVLHHSDTGWTRATAFHSLLDPRLVVLPEVARLSPSFDFLLDDITRLSDEQLRHRALGDLASLVLVVLRDARSPARLLASLARWGEALSAVVRAPDGVRALHAVFRYTSLVADELSLDQLRAALRSAAPDTEQVVMTLAEQLIAEGRQEGRQEGQLAERRAWITRILTARFGPVPGRIQESIASASSTELERWAETVLTAESLDDLRGE